MSADTTPGLEAEREQDAFELAFPMPANCLRFPGGYAPTDFNAWDASKFCERWEGWKAARRAPAPAPQGPTDAEIDALLDSQATMDWHLADDTRSRMRLWTRLVLARWGAPAASGEPAAEEYEQALALLVGLHPGLTIDGPPLEVATRIFDAVTADRAHYEQEIRRKERALESMRAHAWRRA